MLLVIACCNICRPGRIRHETSIRYYIHVPVRLKLQVQPSDRLTAKALVTELESRELVYY
jgi:hypothetical protein